jgi:hypothetical protein
MRSSSRLENLLPHEITHPVVKPTKERAIDRDVDTHAPQAPEFKNKIELMKVMSEARKANSKSSYANRKNNKGKSKRKRR